MQLLLDTHALLWFFSNDGRLPETTRSKIKDKDNNCIISIASLWETVIKLDTGKLQINISFAELLRLIEQEDIKILSVSPAHLLELQKLENHHKDPFDRMIIAQAKDENLTFITKDENFRNYKIKILWA